MVPLSRAYKYSCKVINLLAGYKLPFSVCGVVWRDESTVWPLGYTAMHIVDIK